MNKDKISGFRLFLWFLYLSCIIIYFYYFFDGWRFYTTAINARPRLEEYHLLKPGGLRRHGFGVIGSAMILIMLLYSVRKQIRIFKWTGSITYWLDSHIFLGIFGPLLIILHSAFKVHGLVAVSFYSMLVVAFSGVLGRYLYLQIPRNIKGQELTKTELQNLDHELTSQLQEKFDFDKDLLNEIRALALKTDILEKNILTFFRIVLKNDFNHWLIFNKIKRELKSAEVPSRYVHAILKLAKQKKD